MNREKSSVFSTLAEHSKNLLAAAGAGGVIWGVYANSGLPVPATVDQVRSVQTELNGVKTELKTDIKGVETLVLEGTIQQIAARRGALRAERYALERSTPTDTNARATFDRRLGEISDELSMLDRRENEILAALRETKLKN